MLQNIKGLYGHKLSTKDGEIGHIKDFYFDDLSFVVRYLVIDTGSWLSSRQVLISPHAFNRWDRTDKILHVNLTKKQIEDSPSIDNHRPVSRQYEEDYYGYYGWPNYWEGTGMWGAYGYPTAAATTTADGHKHHGHNQRNDVHLRCTTAVKGYEIEATDGSIGKVASFMVDDKTWALGELIAETGHWYSGKEVLIPSTAIKQISYEESKVYVNLTKAAIKNTAEDEVVKVGV